MTHAVEASRPFPSPQHDDGPSSQEGFEGTATSSPTVTKAQLSAARTRLPTRGGVQRRRSVLTDKQRRSITMSAKAAMTEKRSKGAWKSFLKEMLAAQKQGQGVEQDERDFAELTLKEKGVKIAQSWGLEFADWVLISVNIGAVWIETSYQTKLGIWLNLLVALSILCIICFVLILCFKLFFLKKDFFKDKYNLYDLVILLCSFIPWIVFTFLSGLDSIPARCFRKASILRVIRWMRIVVLIAWMPVFKELWMLVSGFGNSLKVLVWGILLLMIMCGVWGIFICTVVINTPREEFPEEEDFDAYDSFGTVRDSVKSFFIILTLEAWPQIVRPVVVRYPLLWPVFAAFICIAVYAVGNLLTAVLVDSALTRAKHTEAETQVELLRQLRSITKLLYSLEGGDEEERARTRGKQKDEAQSDRSDESGGGKETKGETLSWAQLQRLMEIPKMKRVMETANLLPEDLEWLFQKLAIEFFSEFGGQAGEGGLGGQGGDAETEGDGYPGIFGGRQDTFGGEEIDFMRPDVTVPTEVFIANMQRFKGPAKSRDLLELISRVSALETVLAKMSFRIEALYKIAKGPRSSVDLLRTSDGRPPGRSGGGPRGSVESATLPFTPPSPGSHASFDVENAKGGGAWGPDRSPQRSRFSGGASPMHAPSLPSPSPHNNPIQFRPLTTQMSPPRLTTDDQHLSAFPYRTGGSTEEGVPGPSHSLSSVPGPFGPTPSFQVSQGGSVTAAVPAVCLVPPMQGSGDSSFEEIGGDEGEAERDRERSSPLQATGGSQKRAKFSIDHGGADEVKEFEAEANSRHSGLLDSRLFAQSSSNQPPSPSPSAMGGGGGGVADASADESGGVKGNSLERANGKRQQGGRVRQAFSALAQMFTGNAGDGGGKSRRSSRREAAAGAVTQVQTKNANSGEEPGWQKNRTAAAAAGSKQKKEKSLHGATNPNEAEAADAFGHSSWLKGSKGGGGERGVAEVAGDCEDPHASADEESEIPINSGGPPGHSPFRVPGGQLSVVIEDTAEYDLSSIGGGGPMGPAGALGRGTTISMLDGMVGGGAVSSRRGSTERRHQAAALTGGRGASAWAPLQRTRTSMHRDRRMSDGGAESSCLEPLREDDECDDVSDSRSAADRRGVSRNRAVGEPSGDGHAVSATRPLSTSPASRRYLAVSSVFKPDDESDSGHDSAHSVREERRRQEQNLGRGWDTGEGAKSSRSHKSQRSQKSQVQGGAPRVAESRPGAGDDAPLPIPPPDG
uniref:Ion transport domain-containing protein n=1 Tax=Chromera velia CCMP2878 TaxID=1169474 RepID=A0A0G4I2T6_9ALVE|eukprot:Cvel_10486.t1-p1 / transcript=Cvel_10486.t1 / gene=Cvel_10486 / organism=Chromera_velia_CCMP2878 / gene_product=hypothetical protein / transcript_product=hypothetical protein / location=Cvel_scaffold633:34032-42234(+) / protein_length=1245 / sequence_SO=supercontig / SO=protein_coding / is_pseudo=false